MTLSVKDVNTVKGVNGISLNKVTVNLFSSSQVEIVGVNRVKSVNRAFYSLIMVEETFSLLCLKSLKGLKGVYHTIWMSEDH